MKKISLLLALIMIFSLFAFSSCGGDKPDEDKETEKVTKSLDDVNMHDIVEAVDGAMSYDGLVGGFTYKEEDTDELAYTLYYLWDMNCYEKISDYVFITPTDFNQTLAVFRFDDTATEEDFKEAKDIITEYYVQGRASSLQMYKPDEYKIVKWQVENPDAIWRQYDNTLVLIMHGDSEATAAWEAIDGLLK